MKVCILGANGMLGNALMYSLTSTQDYQVLGAVRNESAKQFFPPQIAKHIVTGIDAQDIASIRDFLEVKKPDVVINSIGIVKQIDNGADPIRAIEFNAMLPHQLSKICQSIGTRLIHISTDCVFSGKKGAAYLESDSPDPVDLYGRTKLLGELGDAPHELTLRTSYIGNEFESTNGLLEWFLAQNGPISGYTKAIYSGLPTVILADLIRDQVLKIPQLHGLYHVSSSPISKYNLLNLVATVFEKNIIINPDDRLTIDRSLDSTRFKDATRFVAPSWERMIEKMHQDRIAHV
ncbi:SDR family oxidoreductase [Polynucleobacter sp. IMCC 29146]|uniref:dTDP-4-dehydrorhamnose reductase family protein n=1 Tax=Polynucleobacter sp. IMCC 29146 TaxID=2780953 RepID=UPI001F234388|nr:SDR family oxidoreductase [Polynucleobacter sp. IMCC 29146]MCE7530587.1 SDR family oxidoreductase [Polynucleobacter sp. IMCC 29146]